MKQFNSEYTKKHKNRFSVKSKPFSNIIKRNDFQRHNNNNSKMKSDDKLINLSEMIPKLLEEIKNKSSSRLNLIMDNNSFEHNSNSSEINDDDEPFKNEINNINIISNINNNTTTVKSPKKLAIQNINKSTFLKLDNNEKKNLEAPYTFRQNIKIDSPSINYLKYSKEDKDSLIIKLHKYFFQDGDLENIDTLIKYNINKIKINDDDNNKIGGEENNENNSINDYNYYYIKEKVISIMDIFSFAFDNENKSQLILAFKELNDFSKNYKFDYVTQLTLDWISQIKDKKYENCELKFIGYYNQIRDIMDTMLNELKKKVDLILVSQENKIKKENDNINQEQNANFHKIKSINKEELLKTKEIIPIKIDIEVNNSLNIDDVEEMLRNLDKGDLGNLGTKGSNSNIRKILNKHFINRNDNEMEAFSYPFKEDNLCYIF